MKKMYQTMSLLVVVLGCNSVFAQNAFIFKGGTADGWVSKNYITTGTNIFKGGNADGWNSISIRQASTNIFRGGTGDGWNSLSYLQNTGGNIFKGGTGDGWDSKNYVQASTVIDIGGTGDGWSSINKVQASTVIHKGGFGDGWASTYRPQGPLPVTLLTFTATRQGSAALIAWKTATEINTNYFEVERSNDAINFNYIGRVSASGNSIREISYGFTDNLPLHGVNYYRLKQADLDGHVIYTPARLVRFDEVTSIIKYYPNPTHGLLKIEITSTMQAEAMVINISNEAGEILDQVKSQSNLSPIIQVDMNHYAKGIYFIQVKTNTSNSVQRIVLN